MMRAHQSTAGFTLIEVMVALAIFVAVALTLDSTMGANIRGVTRYEEKTFAMWVAANKLVELQVYQKWPGNGRQDDEAEFAGRKWFIETTVSNGPYPDTRRVDIAVGQRPEGVLTVKNSVSTLTALLVKPAAAPATPAAAAGGG